MDTISHGLAGSVLARSATPRPGTRPALLLGMLAGMWPDLDFLFLHDRLDYLRNHRGWSHSFVYMPVFALALALLARLLFRQAPLRLLWLFCGIGIVSHILSDWITSFGTMFLVPFTHHRFSLDWVFILDPIFTLIALVGLTGAVLFRRRGRAIASGAAVALLLYVGFCGVVHARALATWKRMDRPAPGAAVAVLPQFLSPFRWLGLSEHPGEIHACFFDVGPFAKGVSNPRILAQFAVSEILRGLADFYPPPERAIIQRFPEPPESGPLAVARALPDVRTYLAFARFPLPSVHGDPKGGDVITWEDLRFLPWFSGPWMRDHAGRVQREPFVYRVRLDRTGRVVERGFVASSRFR
jgi:inner membrane protein